MKKRLHFIICLITTLEKQSQCFTIGYFSSLSNFQPYIFQNTHTHTHIDICLSKARNKCLQPKNCTWIHVLEGWGMNKKCG